MKDCLENIQEEIYSVSQISNSLKFLVEQNFSNIRIKGEISGLKAAPSGHLYFSLKDSSSILSCVCWRGTISKSQIKPEEGLEVICDGSITTYAGQSKYQLIVNNFEHAGVGALMTLLVKRKEMFEKEGIFASHLKKKIPYLPSIIGIVTSPTGAVIKDMLHRLADRMPTRVILWPSLVQGDSAAEQISHAVKGLNNLPKINRPEIIIVARGGGSIEDLWAFNEEIVVRAVANSNIPVISAIGHETDTTLIDYVSDLRAPTPTAAIELATPVKLEIILKLKDIERRIINNYNSFLNIKQQILTTYIKSLPNLLNKILNYEQKLDDLIERADKNIANIIKDYNNNINTLYIRHPHNIIESNIATINNLIKYLGNIIDSYLNKANYRLDSVTSSLSSSNTKYQIVNLINITENIDNKLKVLSKSYLASQYEKLNNLSSLIESYSYHKTLARGYSIIRSENGEVISSIKEIDHSTAFNIEFIDGIKNIKSYQ